MYYQSVRRIAASERLLSSMAVTVETDTGERQRLPMRGAYVPLSTIVRAKVHGPKAESVKSTVKKRAVFECDFRFGSILVLNRDTSTGFHVIVLRNTRRSLSWYECHGQEKRGCPYAENEQCRMF